MERGGTGGSVGLGGELLFEPLLDLHPAVGALGEGLLDLGVAALQVRHLRPGTLVGLGVREVAGEAGLLALELLDRLLERADLVAQPARPLRECLTRLGGAAAVGALAAGGTIAVRRRSRPAAG